MMAFNIQGAKSVVMILRFFVVIHDQPCSKRGTYPSVQKEILKFRMQTECLCSSKAGLKINVELLRLYDNILL
jgi:hypothetical protein